MKLHLFDFDGTISNSDSMLEFLKSIYTFPYYYYLLIKSVPIFVKFHLKIITRDKFKEIFLMNYLSRFSKKTLNVKAKIFADNFENHLKDSAVKYIENLRKDKNNEIIIVSASLDIWIKPIAEKMNIKYITTKSIFKNNSFNGIKGKNCWGEEKVNRITALYNLESFSKIYAYGDSIGDLAMLNIANQKRFRFFN